MAAQADPSRGRFRNYLLGCIKNFLADQTQVSQSPEAQARRGLRIPVDDDSYRARADRLFELAERAPSPEEAFEVSFASDVVEKTLERLRQRPLRQSTLGEPREMQRLEVELRFLLDAEPPPYAAVAEDRRHDRSRRSKCRCHDSGGVTAKRFETELTSRLPKSFQPRLPEPAKATARSGRRAALRAHPLPLSRPELKTGPPVRALEVRPKSRVG